jgi:hypothetical protein
MNVEITGTKEMRKFQRLLIWSSEWIAEYWISQETRSGSSPKLKMRPAPTPTGNVTLLPLYAFQSTVALKVIPVRH